MSTDEMEEIPIAEVEEAMRIAAAHVLYALLDEHNAPQSWSHPFITQV